MEDIVFKDVELVRCLGSGGFGEVWQAKYEGREVAVKKWLIALNSDSATLFQREVTCNRKLKHPNIVKFIGAGTSPYVGIVMEFVPGRNLFEHGHDPRIRYTWGDMASWARQIADAMTYTHENDILHRDLKATNILLDLATGVVKICDFGLARELREYHLQATGGRGSARWMAPEVIEHLSYGPAADVYSFGILLWELCTRRTPYGDRGTDDKSVMEIVADVLYKNLRPYPADTIPEPLRRLMMACWSRDPADRPPFTQILELLSQSTFLNAAAAAAPVERMDVDRFPYSQ